ncbi:MAG: thioredoxin domain-containing protein, partial [Desulfuromonadales bacterium]|nr:thioredoxin domain-containing protein [Desulfuromonadales bacterium]
MTELQQMLLVALEPVVQISTAGAPTLGPDDAPVTIVIFDDFECPYCAKVVPLLREVLAAYPDQIKLVYKNFPLGMHKNARIAAVAGLAAAQQGKFWQLHDLLFANYKKLSEQKITQLAEEAGLDMEKFARARNNPQLRQQINAELQEGRKIGVRGTPTIFVNGRRLPQRSKTAFDQLIRAELARQNVSAKRGETAQ